MRFKALIVRTGVPLPPPSGPARTRQCLAEGTQWLVAARRAYATAVIGLASLLPGGWDAAPPSLGLDTPGDGGFVAATGRRRVRRWFRLARRLHDLQDTADALGAGWVRAELEISEASARRALRGAADAYNFFEDVRWDLPAESRLVTEDGRDVGSLHDVLARSHALAHAAGDLAGGLFGCAFTCDGDDWYDECVLSLLHVRYGNSMGFSARHACTICRNDFATCDHESDQHYDLVAARRENGACTACDRKDCAHRPGDVVAVRARSVMADIDLHEVSLVPRPRDPLARITARQVERGELEAFLGTPVSSGMRLLSHGCMHQCEGFRRPEGGEHIEWLAA